ncbi:MAG: dihydropteroate synthase [Kiritimatiellae bacterium]|nr:dihydropteroate synthase [Kiritimatiellia bacterium]
MEAFAVNCKVMGIVNVTPDSFSDGGKFFRPEEAVRRALNMIAEGADIIDLGGESTRPGATPIGWQEEWARLEPVLKALAAENTGTVPISIDTYHPETAERALDLGAAIINCVFGGTVPRLFEICERKGAEIVIPALSLGTVPIETRRTVPYYLDPMIGFGTSREEDLELLRSIPSLAEKGRVLVGASRKRIVKKLTGEKLTGKNLGGNIGIAVWCAMKGASAVRVHDVRETVQALKVAAALEGNVAAISEGDCPRD